jgi:hypothetical protein
MNLNPIASGNKTISGANGSTAVGFTAGVYAIAKLAGKSEEEALILSWVIGCLPWFALTVVGLYHRVVKAGGMKAGWKAFWG